MLQITRRLLVTREQGQILHSIFTWNCSAKPVMTFPGMVFLKRFTLTLRPVAGMSVSPQVMSSSSASWMKIYWGCMCERREHDHIHTKSQLEREDPEAVFTSDCTIKALLTLILSRNSYTFTVSSFLILSSMLSSRMKVPVRPTPALQCTSKG